MWTESWNTVYDSTNYPDKQIYCDSADEAGYYIRSETDTAGWYFDISSYAGYTNSDNKSKMYFPHKESVDDDNCWGYWVASPSAYNSDLVLYVSCSGGVGGNDCDDGNFGVGPVVCLESNISGSLAGEVWELGTN